MNTIFSAIEYLKYLLTSTSKHGIHSPFVYQLLTSVIQSTKKGDSFEAIENLRKQLLKDQRYINVEEYGAGSKVNTSPRRKIADISKNSLKSRKYSQLIHRLAAHFQSTNMLELGTSFGLTGMYLATANPTGKLCTIEGSPEIAEIARLNFTSLALSNIELHVSEFDRLLPSYLAEQSFLDLVFFDGHHKKLPTLNYFEQCLEKIHNDSVFIFDDIYWSREMKEAWEEIKNHPKVTVTIDLFFLGLVFFRKEQVKEHFKIYY